MFLVELIVSSFLDLISKQARRNAPVSVFLFIYKLGCKMVAKSLPMEKF